MNRFIVDVREPEEFLEGHAKGAINIPQSELMNKSSKINNMPKDAEIIVYCNLGRRADASKKILESMGYTNVINGVNKDQVSAKYGS